MAIGYIAKIANQPIPIYIVLLIHFGHVTHNNLNAIPSTAHTATAENKVNPTFQLNATRQNGAYDPAININIMQ